ncbi:unnamed protein product [Phytophthora lilii]|uniref:Unnamed protein product n=1 Tax=Phytophthora lilii TaxID=2077276 RepID=A0A9W6TYH1_9STRA|nr:unnamed protein product [Phytophthora lilii]
MMCRRLLLLLLAAVCAGVAVCQSQHKVVVAPQLQPPSSRLPLAQQMRNLCANFVAICDFVAENCDDSNPKCTESFNLFYQHNATLTRCIHDLPAKSEEQAQALVFLEKFAVWQTQNACKLFRSTEAKAVEECSGANAHRPWKQTMWPLYCHEVFTMYNSSRHQLDELCGRTSNSEAFWEGFVDYIGSSTCKRYYDLVREARERGCGEKDNALNADECREMFRWYVDNKEEVETDCFEMKASKPFYRGFYTWKKQQP